MSSQRYNLYYDAQHILTVKQHIQLIIEHMVIVDDPQRGSNISLKVCIKFEFGGMEMVLLLRNPPSSLGFVSSL